MNLKKIKRKYLPTGKYRIKMGKIKTRESEKLKNLEHGKVNVSYNNAAKNILRASL